MAISRDEVRHIALLARLSLTPDEEAVLAEQLDHILAHFRQLDNLDTSAVEPTAHIAPIAAPMREDAVVNQPAPDAWLANSPAREERFFKVPKIIE